jgi:hypothetical protein
MHGIYHDGQILLEEEPASIRDGTEVIVTFLVKGTIDLRTTGIDPDIIAETRQAFEPFAPEWDSPEMDIYDDYDASRKRFSAG